MTDSGDDLYAQHWDEYVEKLFPRIQRRGPVDAATLEEWRVLNTEDAEFTWPGDEWGARSDTERVLECTLVPMLAAAPRLLCEIGSGAGRYTTAVLSRYPEARILSFDVSPAFIAALRRRCAPALAAGRLETIHLNADYRCMLSAIEERGLRGKVDAVYSFDALVHVDLHTLTVYFISAARALREGGVLVLNVADATTELGFQKLLADAPGGYARRGMAGATFMWVTGDQVEAVLARCGFEVLRLDCNGRDAYLAARLVNAMAADDWMARAGVSW